MTNLDGVTEPGAPIDDLGTAETTETEGLQPDTDTAQPFDYLDIDDTTSAKHVKVTVDGEELTVPLGEVLNGYTRQADYTRKTQQLAEQRREAEEALQVYQALRTNPGLTMQVLANRAGMSVEEYLGFAQQQAAQQGPPPEEEYADPLERELADTRRQMEMLRTQFEDQQADQRLRQVVNGLKETFGIDDDEARAVVAQTHQMGLGMNAIPLVYRAMAFEQGRVREQTVQQASAERNQTEQQRQAAAAAATAVVGSGGSASGVTQVSPDRQPTSIRDAIEQAFDEVEQKAMRR